MRETRIPPNPIKIKREKLNLTQKELAHLSNVTPQRVLREEQFIYTQASPDIIASLSEDDNEHDDMANEYVVQRMKLHQQFTEDLVTSPFYEEWVGHAVNYAIDYWDALSVVRSPTRLFRESLFEHYCIPNSAVKFSMFTGMHPGTLSDIETGKTDWAGARSLVTILEVNLRVPEAQIQQLGLLHDQFFMRKV